MIYFITGAPGNGKSVYMADVIYKELKNGKNVIANFEINENAFIKCKPEKLGKFIYVSNEEWLTNAYKGTTEIYKKTGRYGGNIGKKDFSYLDGLYNYALNFHKRNDRGQIIEGQTILVFDECDELFNCRDWNRADRLEWVAFFREHRKYGFTCYLISQDDKQVDKQIRGKLQLEIELRALKFYKKFGKILSFLVGGNMFVRITRNYSMKGRKDSQIDSKFFRGTKRMYHFYDSYKTFHRSGEGARSRADALGTTVNGL